MPIFKFSHVADPLEVQGLMQAQIAISASFFVDHPTEYIYIDATIGSIVPFFDSIVTTPLSVPLIDAAFTVDFAEYDISAYLNIAISPFAHIFIDSRHPIWAGLNVDDFYIEPSFTIDNPAPVYIDAAIQSIRPEFFIYEPVDVAFNIELERVSAKFTVSSQRENSLLVETPGIVLNFLLCDEQVALLSLLSVASIECSFNIEQSEDIQYSEIIRFEYSQDMYEALDGLDPDYQTEDVIKLLEE